MFNEKNKEQGLPVWQSPKYEESKAKALEIINDGHYGLKEGDFWILMNKNKDKTKMIYTGLIISHNGCLKINDAIENKVDPNCFSLDKEGYNKSLVYTYVDKDVYEVGEVNVDNCQNGYPYAMAFKRCFDRVVLKKSKLAFSGIYSEVEADEFKERPQEENKTDESSQSVQPKKYNKYSQEKRKQIITEVNQNKESKAFAYLKKQMEDKTFSPKNCDDSIFDEIKKLLFEELSEEGGFNEPVKDFY